MIQQAEQLRISKPLLGRAPIPREHGAWVMLYLPVVVAFVVAGGAPALAWIALLAAVTGLFLAREAAGLLIRKRGKQSTGIWLGIYIAVAAGGALPLLMGSGGRALLFVGLVAGALFGLHSLLLVIPARKRLDRSVWGELLGVAGLTLTGPAAWAVARGGLGDGAWTVWALCSAYFGGGIFYVKMWLEAVKHKASWSEGLRSRLGRNTFSFHAVLTATLLALAAAGYPAGWVLLVAFAPALIRAFYGWVRLSPKLPNLKLVGVSETILALWFGGFLIVALNR